MEVESASQVGTEIDVNVASDESQRDNASSCETPDSEQPQSSTRQPDCMFVEQTTGAAMPTSDAHSGSSNRNLSREPEKIEGDLESASHGGVREKMKAIGRANEEKLDIRIDTLTSLFSHVDKGKLIS